jgi:putative restriction endonuclease
MRYWWVNHKQTFDHEVGKGYVWCPKRKKNGTRNHFYETLREVQKGDMVFSFANAHLQAVGVAKLPCYSCPRPDEFGKVGEAWDLLGWRVDVNFERFRIPLRIKNVAHKIAHLLPMRHSPIQSNGHGNQGAYLAEISYELAISLLEMADPMLLGMINKSLFVQEHDSPTADPVVLIEWEDMEQSKILENFQISETTRKALVHARIGQGKFKENVARYERECRLTNVGNPTHLIASHIKPWRESDNKERLDGGNGLLLTPSIDHLFDRGFISFGDAGDVLISPIADCESLAKMGVQSEAPIFTGRFNSDQKYFLNYHREQVFLKSAV